MTGNEIVFHAYWNPEMAEKYTNRNFELGEYARGHFAYYTPELAKVLRGDNHE